MKKSLILAIISLSLLYTPITYANTSVQVPATFTLNLQEKVKVTNYFNMDIELKEITQQTTMSYPTQTQSSAHIYVFSVGGCPNVDNSNPDTVRCLGMPGFSQNYNLGQGDTVHALGLDIKAISISTDKAQFEIKLRGAATPVPQPIHNVTGTPATGTNVTGNVTICANDAPTASCSVCSNDQCTLGRGPAIAPPPSKQKQPSQPFLSLNLSKGQEIISAQKIDTKGANTTYQVKTRKKARLFYLFPVYPEITYSINSETKTSTVIKTPWWSFLAK